MQTTLWMTGVHHGPDILVAGILLTGLVASAAAFPPGSLALPTRLASIPALGYTVVGLTSAALVITHHLSPRDYIVAVAACSLSLSLIAWKRGGVVRHSKALVSEVKANSLSLSSGIVAITALAVTRPPPLLEYGSSSAWRYWADGAQIADAGRVPSQSPQWGTVFPSTVSKALMNSFDAASSYLLGSDITSSVWALTWFPVVGWATALWAIGYELGLRRTAPLLALAGTMVISLPGGFTANREIARDFQQFKAEDVGRMVAFAALALAIRQVRSGGRPSDATVIGLLFAAAATTHLVPTIIALSILAGVVLATAVERRSIPFRLKSTALGLTSLIVIAIALPTLSGGDIGFQGASGSYQPFHVKGQPVGLDPTAAFIHHLVPFPAPSVRWEIAPHTILSDAVERATGLTHVPVYWALGGAALLICAALLIPGRSPSAVAGAASLAVALIVGSIVFAYRYHTVVPGGFGEKRLFDYIALPWIIVACCLLEGIVHLAGRLRSKVIWPLTFIIVLGGSVFLLTSQDTLAKPSPTAVAGYREAMFTIRATTPCGARVLLNFRTTGSVQMLAHRVGVLEGMAPYLRPNLLEPTLATLYGAQAFFRAADRNAGFLKAHDVDYVVVAQGPEIHAAIHAAGMRVNLRKLGALAGLDEVVSRPGLLIFHVRDAQVHAEPLPGYGC